MEVEPVLNSIADYGCEVGPVPNLSINPEMIVEVKSTYYLTVDFESAV